MSLTAMVWALKSAPVTDPTQHLVLIGLADHAADDGTGARPSKATLAEYARCSVRTVHTKLRALEAAGIIRRGDQQAVAHLRADRRPVVYDLVMHGVNEMHPEAHGVKSGVGRGETGRHHGVNTVADRTVLEPSLEPSLLPLQSPTASGSTSDAFDAFWSVYPRRAGKRDARRAFDKAIKSGVSAVMIVDAAADFRDDPNRVDAYTPHPATWLNQGRWDDDPLPDRGADTDRDAVILRREMRAAAASNAADTRRGIAP